MRKSNVQRRQFLKTAGLASTVGLAGCAGGDSNTGTNESGGTTTTTASDSSSGETKTIGFFSERTGAKETFQKMANEFTEKKGYDNVEIEFIFTQKGQGAEEKLQQLEAAGNVPEIQWVTSLDMYNNYNQGKVEPVTDLVKEMGVPDIAHVEEFGSLYVPIVREPLTVLYRKDTYPDGLPETKAGWLEQASNISDMNGVAITSGKTNHSTTQTVQFLWDNDVRHYEGAPGDVEVVVDKGENKSRAVETFSWMKEIHDTASPEASGWEWGDVGQAYVQDNIASSSALVSPLSIDSNRPELIENLTVSTFPQPKSSASMDRLWCYFEGLSVRKDSDHKELAKEFIQFFPTSEHYLEMFKTAPLWQWPIEQKRVKELREFEVYQRWDFLLDYVLDTWDKQTILTRQGTDGALVPSSSPAYVNTVWGEVAAQLLIADKSPEEAIDILGDKLRKMQESVE
jgi:multiple sugar transport system substrate-binding protein